MDNRGNSPANTCTQESQKDLYLLGKPATVWVTASCSVINNNCANRMPQGDDESFKSLPYQLWTVRYWLTVVSTGSGGLGSDSGEGALETAATSKEGSRRANYPIPFRRGSEDK